MGYKNYFVILAGLQIGGKTHMMFSRETADEVSLPELSEAIRKAQKLTDGEYELYNSNEAILMKLLRKILRLSKQEKEWHVYFYALYEILYEAVRCDNYADIIKYAEVYYKESAIHMDRELPNYPNTNMAFLNTWIYDMIFDAYYLYHQIDDAKMELFMRKFEEAALKYGKTYLYYEDEMVLGALYRDEQMMEHGLKYFKKYENQMLSCYVCGHKQCIPYYLLHDQPDMAEEFMRTVIEKRIPAKHQWCYQYCQEAESGAMYATLLYNCLILGKTEFFRYFYKKYWQKQPKAARRGKADRWYHSLSRYCCAIAGDFSQLEGDLNLAKEDVQNSVKNNTVNNMEHFLYWYCYFELLDKSGVHEAAYEMPELSGGEDGKISCAALSRYFEEKADDFGTKFERARAKFDYTFWKKSWRECAGLA